MNLETGTRRVAEGLRKRLALAGLSMRHIDRQLGWREDRLSRLLRGKQGNLRFEQLLAVLEAACIEERSFFAEVYDLEPKRSGDEIPYSTGSLSDVDAAAFPPKQEVVKQFRHVVEESLRRRSTETGKTRPARPLSDESDLPKRPGRSKK